jgi:hypothetical protein
MSKPLKKGDRVNVYGCVPLPRAGTHQFYFLRGKRAKVIDAYALDEVLVRFADGSECEVHPKQMRRLKAKKRK